jgi:hypothetical protein
MTGINMMAKATHRLWKKKINGEQHTSDEEGDANDSSGSD